MIKTFQSSMVNPLSLTEELSVPWVCSTAFILDGTILSPEVLL